MVRKGQYFIIASLLFASLFFSILYTSLTPEPVMESEHRDAVYFFRNILKEYPYAFDDGINISKVDGYLSNFTLFAKRIAREHNLELNALWIYTKNESDDINLTAGNFMNASLILNINLSGDVKSMYISKDSINSTLFTNPPNKFNLTLTFYNVQTKLLLGKYKYNFYSYLEVGRRRILLKGDVVA